MWHDRKSTKELSELIKRVSLLETHMMMLYVIILVTLLVVAIVFKRLVT